MKAEWIAQKQFLEPFLEFLEANKVDAKLLEPSADAPFYTLMALFPGLGGSNSAMMFEFNLPPETTDIEGGNHLLHIMAIIDNDVKASQIEELFWLTARLNTRLPMGSFGVFDDTRALYVKQSLVFNSDISPDLRVRVIDQHVGMLLAMLNLFIDTLRDVAQGRKSARDALGDHPMHNVYM